MESAPQPDFGPTLPELLAPRWRALAGWQRALAVLAAAALAAALLAYYRSRLTEVHRFTYEGAAAPAFTLRHGEGLKRRPPLGRELVRLESVRAGVFSQRMIVTPFRLPPRGGTVAARLALDAIGYRRRAAGRHRGYRPHLEGSIRVNGIEGYQLVFAARYRPPAAGADRRLFGKVILLPEDLPEPRRGIAIEMLATTLSPIRDPGTLGNRGLLKRPYHSFRFLERQED